MAQAMDQDQGEEATGLRERLAAIVSRLDQEAMERVGKRDVIEDRWLTDLRQFHGHYDDKTLRDLTASKKSRLFINQTRPKTNACEARLSDMLFPTDDKNWGIQPTPVPELTVEAEETARRAAETRAQAVEDPQNPQAQMQARVAENEHRMIQRRLEEARKRARAMEEEIDDHLRQCRYAIQAREVIRDACRIGTGIMKGPVVGGRARRMWQQTENGFELTATEDKRPVFWRVDPWHFFPDPDAHSMDDNESTYERHLMNRKELRKLAREPGFNANAIRRVLRDEARTPVPQFIADLRTITGAFHDTASNRYHVWEYQGPLTSEEMQDIAIAIGKDNLIEDLELDADPLMELNAVIWFCQGEVLKFGIHPLDSGEPIYSVFCLEKDEASIFGFGVPYLMRDSQSAMNGGWRMMMDNAGLSTGPQIEVNKDVVEPADGKWELAPRKIWYRKAGAHPNEQAFRTHNIEMHQAELANIITMAKQFIDDETSITTLAQGEQGAHVTQTAHGMNLLMNATNVVFRRIVKNFDDDMTTPNIRRMYDFLMQFSDKQYIKGDFEVDARGTSVLLVKEMQTANLMSFLLQFVGHPILGRFIKQEGLPGLRRLAQSMMMPADELVKSDDEVAEDEAAAADQPPPPQPEIMKIEAQMNIASMELEGRMQIAQFERETEMMKLAAQHNMTLDQLRAKLDLKRMETGSKERVFAAEAAIEERNAARGNTNGSGGYISQGGGNG